MYKRRSGLKNVKVAIEASANYSYIVDALAKEGYEILVADLTRGNLFPKIKNKIHGELIKRGIMEKLEEEIKKMDKRLKEKEKKCSIPKLFHISFLWSEKVKQKESEVDY